MAKFTPIPVFVDQSSIDNQVILYEERKSFFQTLADMYGNIENIEPLLENDLPALVNNPKQFFLNKLKCNELSLGGLKIEDSKAFDMVEKPTGVLELIGYIEDSKKQQSANKYFSRHAALFAVNDGVVDIATKELERLNSQHTIFLNTQEEKDVYDLLMSVADKINILQETKRIWNIEDKFFTEIFKVERSTDKVSLNYDSLRLFK